KETERFLGLFPGFIYDDQLFNRFVLERDLQRIERPYRSHGFYEPRARAARVYRSGGKAAGAIVGEEGPPGLLRRMDVHGLGGLPPDQAAGRQAEVSSELPLGARLDEEAFARAADALVRELGNEGYAKATVKRAAEVDLPRHAASVGYW